MAELSYEWLTLGSSALLAVATTLFLLWILPLWDHVTSWYLSDLIPRMHDLNMSTALVPGFMRVWAGSLVGVAFLVGVLLNSPPLVIPAVFVVWRTPRAIVVTLLFRRRMLLRDQLVAGCAALANSTRAGMALPQGLEAILPETPEPLATEFRRIHNEFSRGRPFSDCLRDAKQRLDIDAFTLFAAALLTCLDRGGKVTEALDRISKSLQENQRLERKLEADTASGRLVVRILSFAPLFFLGLFGLMNPAGTKLVFTTLLGQVILLVALVLVYIAARWARYLLKIEGGL